MKKRVTGWTESAELFIPMVSIQPSFSYSKNVQIEIGDVVSYARYLQRREAAGVNKANR